MLIVDELVDRGYGRNVWYVQGMTVVSIRQVVTNGAPGEAEGKECQQPPIPAGLQCEEGVQEGRPRKGARNGLRTDRMRSSPTQQACASPSVGCFKESLKRLLEYAQ